MPRRHRPGLVTTPVSRRTHPPDGVSSPPTMCMSVVLPQVLLTEEDDELVPVDRQVGPRHDIHRPERFRNIVELKIALGHLAHRYRNMAMDHAQQLIRDEADQLITTTPAMTSGVLTKRRAVQMM